MSSFDKRVCLWLNNASVPEKQKITTLNRMNVGINNYRNLGLEPTPGTPAAKAEPTIRVDYGLQDSLAKALHKLKDRQKKVQDELKKDEKDRKEVAPLANVLFPTITRDTFAIRTARPLPVVAAPIAAPSSLLRPPPPATTTPTTLLPASPTPLPPAPPSRGTSSPRSRMRTTLPPRTRPLRMTRPRLPSATSPSAPPTPTTTTTTARPRTTTTTMNTRTKKTRP